MRRHRRRRRPKIFGIGWARTGTTSLGAALRTLGYDHTSRDLGLVLAYREGQWRRIERVVRRHESFDDWPWILLYRQLDERFPGSRFVLTVRDPQRWLTSYVGMRSREGPPDEKLDRVRDTIYGFHDVGPRDPRLLEVYERHNRDVRAHFRDRPDDLLVVDWERGDGWPELCGFLGLPVPDAPFPHKNRAP